MVSYEELTRALATAAVHIAALEQELSLTAATNFRQAAQLQAQERALLTYQCNCNTKLVALNTRLNSSLKDQLKLKEELFASYARLKESHGVVKALLAKTIGKLLAQVLCLLRSTAAVERRPRSSLRTDVTSLLVCGCRQWICNRRENGDGPRG